MDSIINLSYKYYNEALKNIKSNNISNARDNLYKAIKLYNEDIDILNLLGSCEYLLCNFDKSKYYWQKSLKYNKENKKAEKYLQNLESDEFKSLLKKYNKGIKCIKNNDFKNAIELLTQVINIDNNIIEPYYLIGLCLVENKEYGKALKYFKIAREKDIGNPLYLEAINTILNNELNSTNKKKVKKNIYKYVIITNLVIILLLGGYTIYNNHLNNQYNSILKKQTEKYKDISLKFKNEEKEVNELKTELKNVNEISSQLYHEIYINSFEHYKNKEYDKSIIGFKYIIDNVEDKNYLKEETIYLLALSYKNNEQYELANDYFKEYIDRYPEGNYYKDSIYNSNYLKTK